MSTLLYLCEDQLDPHAPFLDEADAIVLGEVGPELRRLPFHQQRLAMQLSAMRHFRDRLLEERRPLTYHTFDGPDAPSSHGALLASALEKRPADRILLPRPHDHRLLEELVATAADFGAELNVIDDPHFLSTPSEFAEWAEGRKRLTMEYFYREMRREHGSLMDGDEPAGGDWNYDEQNREAFRKDGPGMIKEPVQFQPDDLTREVIDLVGEHFGDHPGRAADMRYPVTHEEAQRAVRDFVEHRLPHFGTYQDAMWTGRAYLYHSRISAALNLHLVHPKYVIDHAEAAYREGAAPLNAVEGFIRQILGWREYIRGMYWKTMPGYAERNALQAHRDLPDLFWSGETEMRCLREVVGQLKATAYAHHIQRLMVAGLFSQLYGAQPEQMHEWHMAMYADAWEWVSLPNVIGMSQYADGGLLATKPYVATGKYVDRMSNYCSHCTYDPKEATGDAACPFTTLYWDFLTEHEETLASNHRMRLQLRNVERKQESELDAIRDRAETIRGKIRRGTA